MAPNKVGEMADFINLRIPDTIIGLGAINNIGDVVGKDGGYVMAPGSSLDKAEPENLKAMVDFTKEYGRYS